MSKTKGLERRLMGILGEGTSCRLLWTGYTLFIPISGENPVWEVFRNEDSYVVLSSLGIRVVYSPAKKEQFFSKEFTIWNPPESFPIRNLHFLSLYTQRYIARSCEVGVALDVASRLRPLPAIRQARFAALVGDRLTLRLCKGMGTVNTAITRSAYSEMKSPQGPCINSPE